MGNDNINFLNLGFSDEDRNRFNQHKIQYNKQLSSFLRRSREESKNTSCFYCGKPCKSFCNSHSVPRFCLKNIAIDGMVYHSNTVINMPLYDIQKGVNEAGTFHIICSECDNNVFSDYEEPSNYNNAPSDKMLAQIALKNNLLSISKRQLEIVLYSNIEKQTEYIFPTMHDINRMDLNEYIENSNYAKRALNSKWDNFYYLAYYAKIDYVVPIAFQNSLAIIWDFEGGLINDIYADSPDYKVRNINICIFPLENQSVIILFFKQGEKRYNKFLRQFRDMTHEQKLQALVYLLFAYSEDIFLYRGLDKNVFNNEELINIAQQTPLAILGNFNEKPLAASKESFSYKEMNSIPNLLSDKYKVR